MQLKPPILRGPLKTTFLLARWLWADPFATNFVLFGFRLYFAFSFNCFRIDVEVVESVQDLCPDVAFVRVCSVMRVWWGGSVSGVIFILFCYEGGSRREPHDSPERGLRRGPCDSPERVAFMREKRDARCLTLGRERVAAGFL